MSKHTPGPWETDGLRVWSTKGTDPIYIASLKFAADNEFAGSMEAEANASLIAAAPDMYRVVAFMLHHMNTKGVMVPWSTTRMDDGDQETVWNAMHTAIAKAVPHE